MHSSETSHDREWRQNNVEMIWALSHKKNHSLSLYKKPSALGGRAWCQVNFWNWLPGAGGGGHGPSAPLPPLKSPEIQCSPKISWRLGSCKYFTSYTSGGKNFDRIYRNKVICISRQVNLLSVRTVATTYSFKHPWDLIVKEIVFLHDRARQAYIEWSNKQIPQRVNNLIAMHI